MNFNEDSQVKIPVLIHLTRLGYEHLSLKDCSWEIAHNIFKDIFDESVKRINPEATEEQLTKLYEEVEDTLDYEDLGKAFYKPLTNHANSG